MAMTEEEASASLHPLRVLPGGAQAIPSEYWAAGIMLGALALLWLFRRAGHEEGHQHISGTAGIVFLCYYLIVAALVKLGVIWLSKGGDEDSEPAKGLAFFG